MTFYLNAGKLYEAFCKALPWGSKSLYIQRDNHELLLCLEVICQRNVWRRWFPEEVVMAWWDEQIGVQAAYCARECRERLGDMIAIERKESADAQRIQP